MHTIRKIPEYLSKARIWSRIRDKVKSINESVLIRKRRRQLSFIEERLKGRTRVKVAFIYIFSAVWKIDELYQMLLQDERFEPQIFICPYMVGGRERMLQEMDIAVEALTKKGFHFINTYDRSTDQWLDIKNEFDPDIVFFTNPYAGLTKDAYYITNFPNALSCYVPYSCAVCSLQKSQYDQLFHNLLWRFFVETPINLTFSKAYSRIKGENTVVTGYPSLDVFLRKDYQPKDVWKIKDDKLKRVIWAPHHTIDNREDLNFSTFLEYHDFMLSLAQRYRDKIQITFKPHPILQTKLYKLEDWGVERTDAYYRAWDELANGQVMLGEYVDLFYTADIMIFDSISFIMEYLYVRRPGIFTVKGQHIRNRLNKLGQMCLDNYIEAGTASAIEEAIDQLLLGHDSLKEKRDDFFYSVLKPPHGRTASENIYDELKKITL